MFQNIPKYARTFKISIKRQKKLETTDDGEKRFLELPRTSPAAKNQFDLSENDFLVNQENNFFQHLFHFVDS